MCVKIWPWWLKATYKAMYVSDFADSVPLAGLLFWEEIWSGAVGVVTDIGQDPGALEEGMRLSRKSTFSTGG